MMKLKLLNRPTTPSRNIPGLPPAALVQESTSSCEQRQAEQVAAAPLKYQKLLAKAFAGTASKRQAIQCGCLECAGYDRKEISGCRVWTCPLWKYRPYQEKTS